MEYDGMINEKNESISEFEIQEFIDCGSESLVFKAIKKNVGRTYALKFQIKDKFDDFQYCILPFYQKLEQSSVSRIAGIIPDVPAEDMRYIFSVIPQEIRQERSFREYFREDNEYFCFIEDYIQGCNLREYCHGNPLRGIPAHCPQKNASYNEVLDFQKTILNWIVQFCDIMSNITDEKNIIHLDIKPKNIMITDDTKSLILVDFGTSMELQENKKYNLNEYEFAPERSEKERVDMIGSPDFAAPEAYRLNADNKPPLANEMYGIVDQRSDIFSFGATLWSCLTPSTSVRRSVTMVQYYNRDLFDAPIGYSKELENILIKCTSQLPVDRYSDFKSLKEAALEAEKKLPSSYRTKSTRKGLLAVASILFIFGLIFLFLNIRSYSLTVQIAEKELDDFSNVETSIMDFQSAAYALLNARADGEAFERILQKTYRKNENDNINQDETVVLLNCLSKTDSQDIIVEYIDTIVEKANPKQIDSIAAAVAANSKGKQLKENQSIGFSLATALSNLKNDDAQSKDYKYYISVYEVDKLKEKYKTILYAIFNKLSIQTNLRDKLLISMPELKKNDLDNKIKEIVEYYKDNNSKKDDVIKKGAADV